MTLRLPRQQFTELPVNPLKRDYNEQPVHQLRDFVAQPVDNVVANDLSASNTVFDPKELNTKLRKGEITTEEFLQTLMDNDILYEKTQVGKFIVITYEYNGTNYEVNCKLKDVSEPSPEPTTEPEPDSAPVSGPIPPADEDDELTFKKEELIGFDDDAIEKYFLANPDGTYSLDQVGISQDFPEKDYGKIETPAQLKDAIAKKAEADKAGSTGSTSGDNKTYPSGFKNWDECWQSIQNGDIYATVSDGVKAFIGNADIKTVMNKYYKTACDQLKSKLQNGFATDTKDAIVADLINKVLELKKADDAKNDPNQKIKDAANALKQPINNVRLFIVSNCEGEIGDRTSFKIAYSIDSSGNIQFTEGSDAEKVFNKILSDLKTWINNNDSANALKDIGGEAMLKKLLQSAWIDACKDIANDSTQATTTFIGNIMANLDSILTKVTTKPEYLDYYTNGCYGDTSLKNGVPNLSNNVNSNNPKKYDAGEMHLDDDNSDKLFQATMSKLLENIYQKYSNIDKGYLKKLFNQAQENALSYKDMPTGTDRGKMGDLVNLVLYHFDKLFKADVKNTIFAARTADVQPRAAKSAQNDTKNDDIKTGAQGLMRYISNVRLFVARNCESAIGHKKSIHTEFGMDKNGNIVFQENDTQIVFDTILDNLKTYISNNGGSASLQKLGGEAALKQLVQVAWITTYNNFNSSQSNNTTDFVNKVMENLEKMLGKLQTNPELMEVFTTRGSYADTSVTDGLKHYNTKTTNGNDEVISYGGAPTIYADGSVHISNTTDDNDYQTTMNDLLQRLIKKYPSLDAAKITSVFQSAQYKALQALQGNVNDCPYGTGNDGGRVEDTSKNWGGKDNRKGDKSRIDMDELVQMTLYYFDKLIYAELLK